MTIKRTLLQNLYMYVESGMKVHITVRGTGFRFFDKLEISRATLMDRDKDGVIGYSSTLFIETSAGVFLVIGYMEGQDNLSLDLVDTQGNNLTSLGKEKTLVWQADKISSLYINGTPIWNSDGFAYVPIVR